MDFSEKLKRKVRKRAYFQCCRCKQIGVEVHHILPQKDGGKNTEENAAPLCPNCHEMFGDNPTKRKSITEMRDHWYEICDTRYGSPELMEQLSNQIPKMATKKDIQNAVDSLYGVMQNIIQQQQSPQETITLISDMSASFALSTAADERYKLECLACHYVFIEPPGGITVCPHCKCIAPFSIYDERHEH